MARRTIKLGALKQVRAPRPHAVVDRQRVRWGNGFLNRSRNGFISKLVSQIVDEGGVFYRNASGAISLAYVAAGKLLGYSEDHMNAWDYLAGQLMVKEAGGLVEKQDINKVLYNGGRVIAATPAVFERIKHFTERAMSD